MNDEQRPSEQPGAGKATGEEALRESEEQYRALFETMAQGVVYQDAAGRITDANPAAEKILGLSLEQMQGRTSVDPRWRAIHEDGSDFPGETHPAIVALKTGREVRDVVMGVFNPAKEAYSWIMINAAPQSHSDEERPHRVYTTFDDVTKRKQAEEALRESEAQNRALISAFPDILFTNRRDGEFLAVHTSHPELLFAPPETFLHRKVEEIMPKPLADQFMKAFANSLDLETVQELNYALPVGSEQRRLEARVTPCAKDTVITIVRDITERMRAEEALQKSEAKLSNALQMAHAGHWEYDVDRDIFTFNDNFYRIFRTTAAEVGGCQMSSADYARRFCYPDDIAVVANETRAAIESTDPNYSRQIEHRILYADGEVGVITVRFFIVKDPQGRTIKTYGVNQDITERRRAEVLLRESESSLQAILQSTADGFLAVDRENRVLLANGRFEEMWKIPQEIMTSKDDAVLLQYILDQLIDPQGFLQKVQQLYASEEDSFDTLSFKDGRIFERLSRPLMAGTELRGRV
ncbi:MAG: PAS domain S-box protein, partial [bacterium]